MWFMMDDRTKAYKISVNSRKQIGPAVSTNDLSSKIIEVMFIVGTLCSVIGTHL